MTRAEIEALARRLNDYEWEMVERYPNGATQDDADRRVLNEHGPLLAFVREAAFGLSAGARTALMHPHVRHDDRHTAEDDLVEAGMLRCSRIGCSHELCPLETTPLGRAVARALEAFE